MVECRQRFYSDSTQWQFPLICSRKAIAGLNELSMHFSDIDNFLSCLHRAFAKQPRAGCESSRVLLQLAVIPEAWAIFCNSEARASQASHAFLTLTTFFWSCKIVFLKGTWKP